MFSSLIPIHLLTTRLATLKQSATVAREARVQAQEVGVSKLTKFSQGEAGWGYLVHQYKDSYDIPGRHRATCVRP